MYSKDSVYKTILGSIKKLSINHVKRSGVGRDMNNTSYLTWSVIITVGI
ncbi:aldehyde dehydrogenase [Aspergillus luchuensis]|uniref:Aldehyde dehydrogenase n=1 Tax=Aspergillus kawachii TaxID=1069201 RepID=A0A146FX11_ASPKA|nr:aldehyde dehydrogenase [Aspergillus luchuensis]